MIKSLTGFGNIEVSDGYNQLSVMIRSINARFLDIKFHGIDIDPLFELEIRKEIQNVLIRGNITVQIFYQIGNKSGNSIKFDKERFESIENLVGGIQKDYGKHLELSDLISINDLITNIDFNDFDKSILLKSIKDALKQLEKMRQTEGSIINKDLVKRIRLIQDSLKEISDSSKKYVLLLNEKYKERIQTLLDDISINEDRVAQEIAIIVDKYDITEEIVRSNSHCEQLLKFMSSNEPVGKKLNFILQELVREVNTIGSKSPTSEISNVVVEIKSEIEKIREQVQNIL